ncbi:exopolysaccharide biosynthesis polyprenyl glycosylphosphotransferase [Bifidobacterium aerophilum]|uniref:Exopolysaccharide biosynthesis polyprenyl glycosylphosphotransferase n=1 Tax=Bifidobacterium aerophilum TaxID=1798155 RepID=A0A6N9Z5H4_9BIFI|nr:exopolysaccharide biosynthesis polyprenyl glycosylphosphotransferase [Bifidobacterium aerophilum]
MGRTVSGTSDSVSFETGGERASRKSPEPSRLLTDLRSNQYSRVQYWRFFLNLALLLCDTAMFIVGSATALLWFKHGDLATFIDLPAFDTTLYLVVGACAWAFCLWRVGIYHRHIMGDGYQLVPLIIKAAAISWIVLCAVNYVFRVDVPLFTVTMMILFSCVLTIAERMLSRAVIIHDRSKGAYTYATIVVGSPQGIAHTLRFLEDRQQLNYKPVAICPIAENPTIGAVESARLTDAELDELASVWDVSDLPVIDYDDRLAETAVRMKAQTVMVTDVLHRDSDNFAAFSIGIESIGLEIALLTSAADIAGHQLSMRTLRGINILTISLAQYGVTTRILKRLFDIVVSSLLIVLTSPLMIGVAIAIKLDDNGPIFYKQKRIGLRGKPFEMLKFRSMVINADALKAKLAQETGQTDRFIFKMKDDPRITKVGKFTRRFSVDELPQFFNVLRGDMSVVGPRPPLPEEYARYDQIYATRMFVKPGITGPWQVSGRSDLNAEESEQLDVSYVQNWSIGGDIIYVFRTVGAVLGHKGAY